MGSESIDIDFTSIEPFAQAHLFLLRRGSLEAMRDASYFDNSKFREGGPINTIVEREQRKAVLNCMRPD